MRDLIVMYHSVVPDGLAPPGDWLHVPASRFAEQIAWLLRWFEPATPQTLFTPRRRARPRLLITFDDGYANNLTTALPILQKLGAPALFFLSPGYFGEPWFWWDRLRAGLAAVGKTPQPDDFATLKRLNTEEIEAQVTERLRAAGADPAPPTSDALRPLSWGEAAQLAGSPDCAIGNHGWRHEIFTHLDAPALTQVIAHSQRSLRERLGVTPRWVAPPNGNWRADQEPLLQQAGFMGLATTQPGWIKSEPPASIPFRWPRLGVGANDTPWTLARRLVTTRWRLPPVPEGE